MTRFLIKAFIIISVLSQPGILMAESPDNTPKQENKWMIEVRNFKHSFLIKETGMNEEQSAQFIPLYSEMEDKIYQANREARDLEQNITRSQNEPLEDEYYHVATALSQVKNKEAEIENLYFEKFSGILTKKQMFLLKRAENRFAIEMLNHNKRSRSSK